jgi:hypothetical protein
MTSHLIVIPYGTLLIEFHSYNVTDGMAVSEGYTAIWQNMLHMIMIATVGP